MSGVRAPAVPCGRGSARVARASAVTAKATGGVAEVEKQQEQHPTFANLRRSAAAAAAAAVIVAGAPDAALATEYERGVPPAPSNGPLKNLPRGVFTTRWCGPKHRKGKKVAKDQQS